MREILRRILLLIVIVVGHPRPAPAQDSVSISSNPLVKAGESISFTVTLDKAPSYAGRIHIYAEGPDSEAALSSDVPVQADATVVHISLVVPPTAPGGTWHLKAVMFWTGF